MFGTFDCGASRRDEDTLLKTMDLTWWGAMRVKPETSRDQSGRHGTTRDEFTGDENRCPRDPR
jgi:hypothetical protein